MYDACMEGVAPLESDAFEWPGQIDPGLGWPSSALPPEAGLMAQPELVRAIVAKWAARKHALFSDLSTKDEEVLTQAGPNPNPSPNPNPNLDPNPNPNPEPNHVSGRTISSMAAAAGRHLTARCARGSGGRIG